jgi:hydrogenase maturation factor HypF (carbamoyltransferase family)
MSPNPSRTKSRAARVVVFGVVQGVGFRPFVYRIARELGYRGWVKNIGPGVEIHLESDRPDDFRNFIRHLERERPPLARIESLTLEPAAPRECRDFRVRKSGAGESFVFISPDIATCRPCLEEILTPGERRYHYPFTNCTDCGPRYTIVKSLPYDRARTTMARFRMCPDCRREYSDPADRRYHAQPIACPVCGPKVTLLEARSGKRLAGGVERAAALIRKGKILAVKGLGGFHLVCDPWNTAAVVRLRKIKDRRSKPLALMAVGIAAARRVAHVSEAEKNLLLSPSRPIVLLRKKRDIPLIAPGLNEVGIMLAYTPLHHLLLRDLGLIVATSSNKKDSPIMKERETGLARLCDYILDHNPPTSSCGRLFDAASFILGLAPLEMEYEAEAAMRLEAEASRSRTTASYPVGIIEGGPSLEVSFLPAIRGLVRDGATGPTARPARKFHNTVARAVLLMAERARRERGLRTVAIVGGVFLNRILVEETERLLSEAGFRVLSLDQYSPGDESLSLGQVAFGLNWLTHRKSGRLHPVPVKKAKG